MNVQTKNAEAETDVIRHPEAKPSNVAVFQRGDVPGEGAVRPVVAAIAKVMGLVGAVEKRGENKFHGYKYATAADIAHALQKHMADAGLVTVQREIGVNHDHETGILAVRYEFTVMHSSGDALDPVQMTGMTTAKNSKGGFDDKASNKCHTAARKYFLLGLFNIPSGDYPDADEQEDQPEPRKEQPQQQSQPAQRQEPPKQNGKQEPRPFALITGDGVEQTFATGTEYLKAMESEFQAAADKGGFWESNQKTFEGWQAKLVKVGTNQKAIADFSRVGKEIAETVFLLQNPTAG